MKQTDIMEQYPHLKSQWRQIHLSEKETFFQHRYSSDQSEVKCLKSVPMKQFDIYSSRQAYSFPYCPRIYKYIIEENYQTGNSLCFDLIVLSERVTSRLSQNFLLNATDEQIKLLGLKAGEIVRGFDYLFRRFGAFELNQNMIGWTDLGIVKVWFNEDFARNKKNDSNSNQQTMVKTLIRILSENTILKDKRIKLCTTFQSLLRFLQQPQPRTQHQILAQSTFKPLDNVKCEDSQKQAERLSIKSIKSRNNITFSYSNKHLSTKSSHDVNLASNRKCSILLNNQLKDDFFKQLATKLASQGAEAKSPHNSVKSVVTLEKKGGRKRGSHFLQIHEEKQNKAHQNKVKIQRNQETYSKTTVSYLNQTFVKAQSETANQNLHYSISSNPLSRMTDICKQDKAYSTNGYINNRFSSKIKRLSCGSNLSELNENEESATKTQQVEPMTSISEQKSEKETNIRSSQEIQKDLDALFRSNSKFDAKQLQKELECIF